MNFDGTHRYLGRAPYEKLLQFIEGIPAELWNEHINRAGLFNVHRETETVAFKFTVGFGQKVTTYPVWHEAGDAILETINALMVLQEGRVMRCIVVKLPAGGVVYPHVDSDNNFGDTHRIHVPLKSDDNVVFIVDQERIPMIPGVAVEINNQRIHTVVNSGREDRLTLIVDIKPEQKEQDQ